MSNGLNEVVQMHSSIIDGIRYLANEFGERPHWRETIWQASRANPYYGEKLWLFDRSHTSRTISVKVGESHEAEAIFRFLLQNGQYSAPILRIFKAPPPVYTGRVDLLDPNHDPIVRLVDAEHLRIINVTLPTHVFFPGFIVVNVKRRNGASWVDVSGGGRGNWAYVNENYGPVLFEAIISHIPGAFAATRRR